MTMPAIMMTIAAPNTAIAISAGEYRAFFFGLVLRCWELFLVFLRRFFDISCHVTRKRSRRDDTAGRIQSNARPG